MEYQVENVSPVKRTVKVQTDAEEVNAALGATIALYRRDADIKGFRKGKAPSDLIEGRYKKQIYNEATTDLVNLHINQIMGEMKATPVSGIDYEGGEVVKGEDFSYAFSFEVLPDFELPEYNNLEVDEEEVEVTEEEIQAVIDRIRENMSELTVVEEDRYPQDGDVAVITFQAFEDGKVMDAVQAENFHLQLGEGQALGEFEEAVKALKPGEQGEKDISFPDDFLNKDLAGRTVTMRIILHSIKEKKLPEMTDEMAKEAGGFATVDAMRQAVKATYEQSRVQMNRSVAQKRLLDKLLAKVDFPVPESLIEGHVDQLVADLTDRVERQGRSIESLGKTGPQLREEFRPQAIELAKSQIFLINVAQAEGFDVTDKELDFYFQQMAARSGEDFYAIKKHHIENNLMYAVRDRMLADKAMEHLYSQAMVNKVPAGSLDAADGAAAESEAGGLEATDAE